MLLLFSCSVMSNFVTPWTVTHQAPLSFSGKNIGLGCNFLLQAIFLTQGLKLQLLPATSSALQADSLLLSHQGSPIFIFKVKGNIYIYIIQRFIKIYLYKILVSYKVDFRTKKFSTDTERHYTVISASPSEYYQS